MNPSAELRPRSPAAFVALPASPAFARTFTRLARVIDTWRLRHKSSMQCARVDARVLRDLGISDAQRFIAVNKPFWER